MNEERFDVFMTRKPVQLLSSVSLLIVTTYIQTWNKKCPSDPIYAISTRRARIPFAAQVACGQGDLDCPGESQSPEV